MAKYRFFCVLSVLLMLIAVATYAARDEATAEAVWNFDDGDAADTSGKGLDGTIVGDPEVKMMALSSLILSVLIP